MAAQQPEDAIQRTVEALWNLPCLTDAFLASKDSLGALLAVVH